MNSFEDSFERISEAIELAHSLEREVILDIAGQIDPRLYDQFDVMINNDGYSIDELKSILETIQQGSTDQLGQLMDKKFNEYHKSPEQKSSRRRENWQAFVRGLGGVGMGMAAIGEGMSNIGFFPRRRK
jgi:hypothetical protein